MKASSTKQLRVRKATATTQADRTVSTLQTKLAATGFDVSGAVLMGALVVGWPCCGLSNYLLYCDSGATQITPKYRLF